MNKKYRKLKMVLMAAIAILFSGIYASADCGKEYGHQRGMHQYKGWHLRGSGGPGCGALNNLSEDDIEKLDAERKVFFEATKVLRRKIYQKRLELASELAKESPDAATAAALQTEISDFKAQMAQKRLEHILRVQKINPDLGRGFWGGGHIGPGMMEPGEEGSWGPNNCPYSDCGGNCGRGQRMMHRGGFGMGPGYGRGPGMMGPGCSDRDDSRQYHRGQGSQAE